MSKSVDETVFDYFSLLLTEPAPKAKPGLKPEAKVVVSIEPVQKAEPLLEDNIAAPVDNVLDTVPKVAPLFQPQSTAKRYQVEPEKPRLDRSALEQLLAPVFREPLTETPTSGTQTETVLTTAAKLELSSEAVVEQAEIETGVAKSEPELQETVQLETQVGAPVPPIEPLKEQLEDEFQVLFFKVAGLTLAVPLISLGGIVRIERINHIFGRPGWFMGVQGYRESQLNIVDTCAWVMPEKYDDKLAQSVNYQYLVVLENSNWGLACESLVNAVKIDKSQVNWRGSEGKRPWLAGVVKEQMCGILHVQALIEMLNAGLGCQDPID
ncbi:chemotaxis protein CheW [Shewanella algae]